MEPSRTSASTRQDSRSLGEPHPPPPPERALTTSPAASGPHLSNFTRMSSSRSVPGFVYGLRDCDPSAAPGGPPDSGDPLRGFRGALSPAKLGHPPSWGQQETPSELVRRVRADRSERIPPISERGRTTVRDVARASTQRCTRQARVSARPMEDQAPPGDRSGPGGRISPPTGPAGSRTDARRGVRRRTRRRDRCRAARRTSLRTGRSGRRSTRRAPT